MSPKIVRISAKCDDRVDVDFDGKYIGGTVPNFFGSSDYIALEVDAETGQIIGWPGVKAVETFMKDPYGEGLEEEDDEED